MNKQKILDILSNDSIIMYAGTDRKKIEQHLKEARKKSGVQGNGISALTNTVNSCPTAGAGCNCPAGPALTYCIDSASPCSCP